MANTAMAYLVIAYIVMACIVDHVDPNPSQARGIALSPSKAGHPTAGHPKAPEPSQIKQATQSKRAIP